MRHGPSEKSPPLPLCILQLMALAHEKNERISFPIEHGTFPILHVLHTSLSKYQAEEIFRAPADCEFTMTSWPWMKGVGVAVAEPIAPVNEHDDRPSAKALIDDNRKWVRRPDERYAKRRCVSRASVEMWMWLSIHVIIVTCDYRHCRCSATLWTSSCFSIIFLLTGCSHLYCWVLVYSELTYYKRRVIDQVKKELETDPLYDASKHDHLWYQYFM